MCRLPLICKRLTMMKAAVLEIVRWQDGQMYLSVARWAGKAPKKRLSEDPIQEIKEMVVLRHSEC
jgi:hypothetical protein